MLEGSRHGWRPPIVAVAVAVAGLLCGCADDDVTAGGLPNAEIRVDGLIITNTGNVGFGEVEVGATRVTKRFVIASTGAAPLTLTEATAVRLERDDRLAFSVIQPEGRVIAPGGSAAFDVAFGPRAAGETTARLVITTDAPDAHEIVIGMQGTGFVTVAPHLALTADGAPLDGGTIDLPITRTGATHVVQLGLANAGGGTLALSPTAPLRLIGPDAAAFALGSLDASALDAGDRIEVSLTFAPERCGEHDTTLVIARDDGEVLREIALTGFGLAPMQRFPDLTDASQLNADVAVSATADGAHLAVANPTGDTFFGQLELARYDRCDLVAEPSWLGDDLGFVGSYFGTTAALGGDAERGHHLLVTARDHHPVWLFDPATGLGAPPLTLTTSDPGAGFGRAAALSTDGEVAVVSQPLAATQGHTHGAIFAYRRGAGAWASRAEADAKLVAPVFAEVDRVGQSVAVSADGSVIAGAMVRTASGAPRAVAACVWRADGATWGVARVTTNSFVRNPDAILQASAGDPSDGAARVGISADGRTIVLSAAQAGGSVSVFVFVAGDDGSWGVPTATIGVSHETARLRVAGGAGWRFAIATDGAFIVGADLSGLGEFVRPTAGWSDGLEPARTWALPFVGGVALGAGDAFVAGIDPAGALRIVWR